MANSLTSASPTLWSKMAGYKLFRSNVFKSLASFEQEAVLTFGQIVDRPYRSNIATETYTKATAAVAQDISYTSDQLTVNVSRDAFFYLDNIDKIQNKYETAQLFSEEIGTRLANDADAWFLYEAINASNTIDDASIGGTSGNGIVLTITNIIDVYGKINEKFNINNVPRGDRYIVITPQWENIIWQYVQGKHSAFGDRTAEFANLGEYAGIQHYTSNNICAEASWLTGDAAIPSNTETLTIEGVVFTWVTTIGSTAGNVLAVTDLATSIDNLVALINAGGVGDGVNNVSLSAANKRAVSKWVAVDNTTSITVRVRGAANGFLTVSNSQAADPWTPNLKFANIHAGRKKKSVDMVIQKEPQMDMDKATISGLWGSYVLGVMLWGVKTFNAGASELVRIKLCTKNFS